MTPTNVRRVWLASLAAVIVSLGLNGPVAAEDLSDSPSEAAAIANEVAGQPAPAIRIATASGEPGLSTSTIDVSVDPADGIAMDAAGGSTVSIGLPNRDASLGTLASGNVIYQDVAPSTTVAARPVRDGAQALLVIENARAPSRFTFPIDLDNIDADLAASSDGSVRILGANQQVKAVVHPAWAIDAAGHAVPTHFEVLDGVLVQVIDHAGAEYPVVADPKVSAGWKIYVKYSKTEVHRIASNPVSNKFKYAAAICAAIPSAVAAAGCGLYVYDSYASISSTFETADKKKRCVEMQYLYTGLLVGWKSYSC